MKERKSELSILNVFFCMLVIFIHVSSNPVTFLPKGSLQLAALYAPWKLSSFVVYGFLFLGGIRFSLKPPGNGLGKMAEYYKKRLFRVVIPYVIWVFVYCLWNQYLNISDFSFSNFFYCLYSGKASPHFYYIIIAIQFYILAPLWKMIKKESAPVVLPVSLALTLFFTKNLPGLIALTGYGGEVFNDRIFTTYLFYWLAGIYAGLYYDEFFGFLKKHKVALTVFFVATAVPEAYFNYRGHAYSDWYSFTSDLHTVYICAAILFFSMIAFCIKDFKVWKSKLFMRIDRCTFSIYLFHLIVMEEWDIIQSSKIQFLTMEQAFFARAAVTYLLTIAICSLVSVLADIVKKKLKKKTETEKA